MSEAVLPDSTVVIVGTGAVELEIARQFVTAGVQRIGLVGRDAEHGATVAETVRGLAPGIWALFVAGDVTDPAEAARVAAELEASLGPTDVLVKGTSGPCHLEVAEQE